MDREGVSPTMALIIFGTVMLAMALGLLTAGNSSLDWFKNVMGGEEEESQAQLAESRCEIKREDLCDDPDITGTEWAGEAIYSGKNCTTWAREAGIYGGEDDIPSCGS